MKSTACPGDSKVLSSYKPRWIACAMPIKFSKVIYKITLHAYTTRPHNSIKLH